MALPSNRTVSSLGRLVSRHATPTRTLNRNTSVATDTQERELTILLYAVIRAYLSCNDQMTNTACLTLAGPQQTSCACATASTVYTYVSSPPSWPPPIAVHVSIFLCNTANLASVTSCFTKYCTPDDTWTGLADSLSACAALGYGSGPGPGGVPVTATPNGGGGGGSGGSTPTATAGGGAAPTTTGKNAGPMSPAPLGRDYIMTGLFGLAWIVGLAGFAL